MKQEINRFTAHTNCPPGEYLAIFTNSEVLKYPRGEREILSFLILKDENSPLFQIFYELKNRLEIRKKQKAFHPDATQFTLHLKPGMFGFWRQSLDRKQSLFVVTNITHEEKLLSLRDMNLYQQAQWKDLLSNTIVDPSDEVLTLSPYQSIWITNVSG